MSPTGGNTFTGLAVWGSGASRVVFAADGTNVHAYANGKDDVSSGQEEGDQPFRIRMPSRRLTDSDLVFTDLREQVIRLYRHPDRPLLTSMYAEAVAESRRRVTGLAFADGPASAGSFLPARRYAVQRHGLLQDAGQPAHSRVSGA